MFPFFSRDPLKDLPYEVGEPAFTRELAGWTCFQLRHGKVKATGEEVTVFHIPATEPDVVKEVARAASSYATSPHVVVLPSQDDAYAQHRRGRPSSA